MMAIPYSAGDAGDCAAARLVAAYIGMQRRRKAGRRSGSAIASGSRRGDHETELPAECAEGDEEAARPRILRGAAGHMPELYRHEAPLALPLREEKIALGARALLDAFRAAAVPRGAGAPQGLGLRV
jgi:hypothetical protein